jgi:hypothetical protein
MDEGESARRCARVRDELRESGEAAPGLQHRIEALTRSIEHLQADLLRIRSDQAEARSGPSRGRPAPCGDDSQLE